jgi:HEAT repeat protein
VFGESQEVMVMTSTHHTHHTPQQLAAALESTSSSARLQIAMAAGSHPEPGDVTVLIRRSGVEPDFFVRDMLVWALLSHPADLTVPALLAELGSANPQARAQSLHALSKIGDPRGWPAVTDEFIESEDDDVARSAWRAAAALVPENEKDDLARRLAGQLGRGDHTMQLSLSRAYLELGEAGEAVLNEAAENAEAEAALHAEATLRMIRHPELGFDDAREEAMRVYVMGTG